MHKIYAFMLFKVFDLEKETFEIYKSKPAFCKLVGISERNFNNRWRLKQTVGIVIKNRWYIKEIELCE